MTEASASQRSVLSASAGIVAQLLRVEDLRFETIAPDGAIPFMAQGVVFALPVAEFIDLAAEKIRLAKDIAGHVSDVAHVMKKLGNPDFLARAKEEVIEENRERLAEAEAAKAKLESALKRLEAVV